MLKVMDNGDIKGLIMASVAQTSGLITLWGLANYMNQSYDLDESIIYQTKLYNLNIKITGKIFFGMASVASFGIMCFDLIKLSQYKL